MVYDAKIHHRRSIRYEKYDYSQDGAYFVTICAQDMKCLFGDIKNGKMDLNEAGKMADFWWREIPNKFKNIRLDEFTVMPNHFHGIFWILNSYCRGNPCGCPNEGRAGTRSAPTNTKTVGNIVGAFKSLTTVEYIRNVKLGKLPPFEKSVWQRNYWEHIIRDDEDLNRIREYIINNQLNWEIDEFCSHLQGLPCHSLTKAGNRPHCWIILGRVLC